MLNLIRYVYVIIISILIFPLLAVTTVKAQYDSDGFPLEPGVGIEEIFGINIDSGETATFFPGRCQIIDSIKLKAKKDISGSIEVTSYGTKNPTKTDKDLGKKAIEFCGIQFKGFSKDDVESSIFQVKANKDKLDELDLKNADVRFFQFNVDGNKWKQLDTPQKSETNQNYYYEVDSVDQYRYYSAAEKTSAFGFNIWIIVICAFLLLLLLILFLIISSLGRKENEKEKKNERENQRQSLR
ncbi:PGF-pre-PGF domain-containing protein [Candidatus Dojkabacteria bacterium]|nr:PGF-pre-PGF domain-containing protein [Candidatus Dojkabacteria bacterium]